MASIAILALTINNAFFLGAIFLLFKDLKEIITATGHRKSEI